jgi:hypothetical protein
MLPSLLLICVHALQQPTPDLVIPGFTAYGVPDRDRFQVDSTGVHNWTNPQQSVAWHGRLSQGILEPTLNIRLPEGQTVQLRILVANRMRADQVVAQRQGLNYGPLASSIAEATGMGDQLVSVTFPSLQIPDSGYKTIAIQGMTASGSLYPDVESLTLRGSATVDAHFNLKPRRNAASVHLSYPIDKDAQVAWFYNEVTPHRDPIYTYYMACGFSRGYFGIQVNSRTERRIIFSVWDSGSGDDPALKSQNDRTQLIAKGDDVVASDFGNEGTGGHSHLVYPWTVNTTYRFLVGAKIDGDGTIYSGYFFDPAQKKWVLIASFRAPKDGKLLRGLYSFDEDFSGSNGDLERLADFGNGWVGTSDSKWKALLQARFTHDATGDADRLDYSAKADGDQFSLRTGGFIDEPTTVAGTILIRDAGGDQPKDLVLPPQKAVGG